MRNILLLALLAGATAVEAAPATVSHISQDKPDKKEMKMKRKARRQNGPEVYKGTVAEQRRIVTDAQGAEKEDGDDTSRKERKSKKN